jgi:hypothetical protein
MLKIALGLPCVQMKVLVLVCMMEMGGGCVGGWVSDFSRRSRSHVGAYVHLNTSIRARARAYTHTHTHTQETLVL